MKIVVIVLLVLAAELAIGIVLGKFIAFGMREPREGRRPPGADGNAPPEEADETEAVPVETDTDKS